MADNFVTSPGSGGVTFASDDVSGVHYPRTKIVWGPDGTVNETDVAAQKLFPTQSRHSSGTEIAILDNAAFTDGTSPVVPAGYVFDETAGTTLTENDIAGARVDVKRAQVFVIEDETTRGRRVTVTAANALKVDPSGVTQTIAGSVTVAGTITSNVGTGARIVTNLTSANLLVQAAGSAATDAAVSGNPVYIAGRASAAAPSDVSADGDAVPPWLLRNGAQATVVTAAGALVGGDATNGLDVDVTRVGGTVTVGGVAAHDAAVSGSPVLVGLEARTTDGTAVTSGDAVRGLADTLGKQVVLIGAVNDLQVNGKVNLTNSTASDIIGLITSARIAIMGLLVTNGHATVGTKVEIRDGTTVKAIGYAAAAGGGFVIAATTPIIVGTSGTAITGRCVTTGADVDIMGFGYRIAN